MIAACPKCEARYRVDESRIGAEGARLRCAKCEVVFRVRAPTARRAMEAPVAPAPAAPQVEAPVAPAPAPTPVVREVATPQAAAPAPAEASSLASEEQRVVDRDRLVVVADSEVDVGKSIVSALSQWGLQPVLVHDGVEAMMAIQRMLPRIVILDAALPKMYGFQVCEVIKRNESLCNTRVILVGAIHNQARYHRPPAELYGADCYLERPDLPEGLESVIAGFGIELARGAEAAPAPPAAPVVAAPPVAAAPPAAAPAAPVSPSVPSDDFSALESPEQPVAAAVPAPKDELAEARSEAERLARIIVSDVILYQPDKFAEGVRNGNVVEVMDSGIEEGRTLFRQRIDSRVRDEKDFIVEELTRIARERGMQ